MDEHLILTDVTYWLESLAPEEVVYDRYLPLTDCVVGTFLRAKGYTPLVIGYDFAYITECKEAITFDDTLADAVHLWSDLGVVTAEQALAALLLNA